MDGPDNLSDIERPFTFAVVGDTHYSHPRFYPDLDQMPTSRRPLPVENYLENVNYVLSPMMEALKEASPAFVNEEELDPEQDTASQHESDEELDELRQRLRKLEERLKG